MWSRIVAYLLAVVAFVIIFGFPAVFICKAVGFLFGFKFWTGILYTLVCEVYAYTVASFLVKKLNKFMS